MDELAPPATRRRLSLWEAAVHPQETIVVRFRRKLSFGVLMSNDCV
jgi:hypothetical protein